MELQLANSGLQKISREEEQQINGGGILGGLVGIAAGFIIDAVVEETTGKSCSDWIKDGFNYVKDFFSGTDEAADAA